MSGDLAAFLAARLDEEETAARATLPRQPGALSDWEELNLFLLRWAEAGRAILRLHRPFESGGTHLQGPQSCWSCGDDVIVPCDTLLALAAVYSDHPDYRPEWKPS